MAESDPTKRAEELLRSGKKEEARELIASLLKEDNNNVRGWALLYHAAKDRQEALLGLRQVLRLKPDNEWATEQLARLESGPTTARQPEPITPPVVFVQPPAPTPGPSDALAAAVQMKSFVGSAVVVFFLYFLFYVPGVIFNILYLNEAGRIKKLGGRAPTGMGCLQILLVMNVVVPLIICFLLGGLGGLGALVGGGQ